MFRSHWTIIREHVVPVTKLPLIVYWYDTLWFCCRRTTVYRTNALVQIVGFIICISRTIARYRNENDNTVLYPPNTISCVYALFKHDYMLRSINGPIIGL